MSTVVLGITGSISAYKACELTRLLIKEGHEVCVLMTPHATKFVTPLTFQTLSKNPVEVELFGREGIWKPTHISLAQRADVFVIAPCTANAIGKIANGIADDLLSSTAIATKAPILIAPAMNVDMWNNVANQANLKTLQSRGVKIIDAETGELACGTVGKGRMADPATIVKVIDEVLASIKKD